MIGWSSNDRHWSDDVRVLATILNPVLGLQVRLSDLGGHSGLDTYNSMKEHDNTMDENNKK